MIGRVFGCCEVRVVCFDHQDQVLCGGSCFGWSMGLFSVTFSIRLGTWIGKFTLDARRRSGVVATLSVEKVRAMPSRSGHLVLNPLCGAILIFGIVRNIQHTLRQSNTG